MSAIAYAQLAGYLCAAHGLVEVYVAVEEEVVVATVDKPCHCAQLLLAGLIGILHIVYAAQSVGGVKEQRSLVALGHLLCIYTLGTHVQEGAHGIACTKHVGMALCIAGAATSTHGEACYGAVLLVGLDAVLLLYRGQELGEEEFLVVPPLHVEVAVPLALAHRAASIGAHDDHGIGFARGGELVHHVLYMSAVKPVLVRAIHAVQQVEHRVCLLLVDVVSCGQVHRIVAFGSQHLALDSVFFYSARISPVLSHTCQAQCHCHEGDR